MARGRWWHGIKISVLDRIPAQKKPKKFVWFENLHGLLVKSSRYYKLGLVAVFSSTELVQTAQLYCAALISSKAEPKKGGTEEFLSLAKDLICRELCFTQSPVNQAGCFIAAVFLWLETQMRSDRRAGQFRLSSQSRPSTAAKGRLAGTGEGTSVFGERRMILPRFLCRWGGREVLGGVGLRWWGWWSASLRFQRAQSDRITYVLSSRC